MGFSNGIGQPDIRAFIGFTYTKRPLAEVAVPPPPISEIQVGDELTLKDKIFFEFDKDKIRDISMPTMDKIAAFLKAHPEVTKIKIDGYTCDLGREGYNLKLSQRRANAATNYLVDQGVDRSRVGTVTGYGEANPMVPNLDEAHREQNRRVQIFVEAVDPSLIQPTTTTPAAEAPPAETQQ
jgi:outer membrane protein OmpA-like peptidoglycan-associated protein